MTETEFLKSYDPKAYDAPLCTVDMAIFAVHEDALRVLLVRRDQHPYQSLWALPGGFANLIRDKDIEATAFRKLKEKTGLTTPYLEQVESIGNATRDPRGWSITLLYFALIDFTQIDIEAQKTGEEVSEWVDVADALNRKLAFDHSHLITKALDRLRSKTRYTALPLELMPQTFTLTELQHIFELVLGHSLEKKSFRRRLETAGILSETGDMRATTRRPAALYQISSEFTKDFIFPGLLEMKKSNS